jgi:hypothetical protein
LSGQSKGPRAILAALIVAGEVAASIQSALARGGGGPPVGTMTLNYCRETVYNKGVTGVMRFEEEVKKCMADPVTYPPAYNKPAW